MRTVVRILSIVLFGACIFGLVLLGISKDDLYVASYSLQTNLNLKNSKKFVYISDLHNHGLTYGNNKNLIDEIKGESPDYLMLGGDLIDENTTSLTTVKSILDSFKDLKSIYVSVGNNEHSASLYSEFETLCKSYENVKYLYDGVSQIIDEDGKEINVYGIHDPSFDFDKKPHGEIEDQSVTSKNLTNLIGETYFHEKAYNIMLCHRPYLGSIFNDAKFDLVLSGHNHGGVMKLLPKEAYAPKVNDIVFYEGDYVFDNGKHSNHMLVSSGLGFASSFPLRINCNPSILSFTLN